MAVQCAHAEQESRFAVEIVDLGVIVLCRPGESLLREMVASGQRGLAVGCRSGGCGVCRIQVLDGDFATGPMSRGVISVDDERAGLLLACRMIPRSDMRVASKPLRRGIGCTPSGLAA